jgi:hypothetical protein
MSDLEDFYAELDARMAMPDEDWQAFSARGRKYCSTLPIEHAVMDSHVISFIANSGTSSSSELVLPSLGLNDDLIPRATPLPVSTYMLPPLAPDPNSVLNHYDRSCKRKPSPPSVADADADHPQEPKEGSEQQPLSAKRGSRDHCEPSLLRAKATSGQQPKPKPNTVIVATSAPAFIQQQDMSSLIEEFTDHDVADSPAATKAKGGGPFVEETSNITTPGNNTPRRTITGAQARARSEASFAPPKPQPLITSMAKQSAAGKSKSKSKSKKKAAVKPELVTPAEFARRLREHATTTVVLPDSVAKLPVKTVVQPPQHLKDYVIFYTGGDLKYASARTRGCMSYVSRVLLSPILYVSNKSRSYNKTTNQIHKHGGTVLPTFDPTTSTHIVTETNEKNTLSALGLKNLSEIPQGIPTVKWSWVISGKCIPGEKDRQQMDYEFMHAAFPSRMDAGPALTRSGKGKQMLGQAQALVTGDQRRGETPCVVVVVRFPNNVCMLICVVYAQKKPTRSPVRLFITRLTMRDRRRGTARFAFAFTGGPTPLGA